MVVFEAETQDERRVEVNPILVGATIFILLVVVVAYAVLFHTLSATTANRILGISMLIALLTFAWWMRLRSLIARAAVWQQTADALGLELQRISNPLQKHAVIEGECRGRNVRMCTTNDTRERILVTCIDMDMACQTDVKFRIYGPLNQDDLAYYAGKPEFARARRFGVHKNYLLICNAPHLGATLFTPSIWNRLQALNYHVNISLYDEILSLEQPGATYDPAQLVGYVDLLSEIAYVVTEWEMRWRQDADESEQAQLASPLIHSPA